MTRMGRVALTQNDSFISRRPSHGPYLRLPLVANGVAANDVAQYFWHSIVLKGGCICASDPRCRGTRGPSQLGQRQMPQGGIKTAGPKTILRGRVPQGK